MNAGDKDNSLENNYERGILYFRYVERNGDRSNEKTRCNWL